MRTIGVLTVARSDYGIYRPVLRALAERGMQPAIFAGPAHSAERFGRTLAEIEADRWPIAAALPDADTPDDPAAIAERMGSLTAEFARALAAQRPDMLLALGDRWEMFAGAAAAAPMRIPVAHLHGGETTEGAIDELFRHAITKLSHLHFAATERHARRLVAMGEEPWRVLASGAPGLDAIVQQPPLADAEWRARLGFLPRAPYLLVTFHPVTQQPGEEVAQAEELLAALDGWPGEIVFTGTNADAGGRAIRERIGTFVARLPGRRHIAENAGSAAYIELMRRAAAMVGNSSSGIIEAASLRLPVVNVGDRQRGRDRGANVTDAPCTRTAIAEAIARATAPEFRALLGAGFANPYGDGRASERIAARLAEVPLDARLLAKRFHDVA
jgi:UDP-hydrolysing UDP-N-acetyl-D-glucosamine 2-epimerase